MDKSKQNLSIQIEAVLFWKAEPISLRKLATYCDAKEEEISLALTELRERLSGRGITIIENGTGGDAEITLGTAPEVSSLIEKLTKDDLMRDLGKAGLETLSIVLYQGPISRAGIDYIRGVNSQFILRNLLVRGLVERVDNPSDQRSFLYKATTNILAHLGVTSIETLPEYEAVRNEIEGFKKINSETTNVSTA